MVFLLFLWKSLINFLSNFKFGIKNNEIWLGNRMRMLTIKLWHIRTHTNKKKMNVTYEDLLERFKSIKLQGTKPYKNWYSTLSSYHNLWNFSELRFSISYSIFKLLNIISLIWWKLWSVGPVQQKLKLPLPNNNKLPI